VHGRGRHRPGSRWHYSNFGGAVLGHALAAATGTSWEQLLRHRVLAPLGLTATGTSPGGSDATGHRRDGHTPVPPLRMGGLQPAGAVRAAPHDLLRYLEAHLRPVAGAADAPLAAALHTVRRPLLRRGLRHRHTHTAGWFHHLTEHGPMLFHGGASFGQQAFLGFRPTTRTAVAAVCTRRFRRGDALLPTAYALLSDAL
jgi:CubicO group peptidase (beta-lactamase class C family)